VQRSQTRQLKTREEWVNQELNQTEDGGRVVGTYLLSEGWLEFSKENATLSISTSFIYIGVMRCLIGNRPPTTMTWLL